MASELGRVRDLPRPLRCHAVQEANRPTGACPVPGTSGRTATRPRRRFEWFGGDLPGVEAHLDHIESLGANVIYLTPIFPAGSTHRYDATTFDHVDPLLGGDEALVSLTRAAHARGLRVISDLTTNHTGDKHEWFTRGERELYLFDESGDYEAWWGIKSLPKLNWLSPELRARMQAVTKKWLQPPYVLDGWRVDVANMSGRTGATDVNRDVAPTLRQVLNERLAARGGALPRFPPRLPRLARGDELRRLLTARLDVAARRRSRFRTSGCRSRCRGSRGDASVASMRAFRAGVPWDFSLHSWAILDSHDTARFRTVAGSEERQLVGVGLQMTLPGVPMLFAGDELGLEGEWGEDARRTMPWGSPLPPLFDEYRRLIGLRRTHDALARGGLRYAYVDDDVIAYVRETRGGASPLPGDARRACTRATAARRAAVRGTSTRSTATTPSSKAAMRCFPQRALRSTSGG